MDSNNEFAQMLREGKKVLLCRPRGGLNDMLNQVAKCWDYADRFDRVIWIDTMKSGFLDTLGNYFLVPPGVFFGSPIVSTPVDCFPSFLDGDPNNYQVVYNSERRCFVHVQSQNPVTFDFNKNYDNDIIVHHQSGGGIKSFEALERLRFKPGVAAKIRESVERLGEYDAIHVRNTDYKTDYVSFFETVKNQLGEKIVLCTDDFRCQQYAMNLFGDRLLVHADVPDTKGKPLHMNSALDRPATNIASLIDLFVLAGGKKIFYTKVQKGHLSGFTRLALKLRENPTVRDQLIYE